MSFLLNLYKYREREKINQLENYCTEALKYCLFNDKKLREWLLEKIKLQLDLHEKLKEIKTQKIFPGSNIRPDIFIEFNNSVVIVECKIESSEREGQLKDYATLLNQKFKVKQKHLIYLTRYNDKEKNRNFEDVHFTSILWSQLCNSINEENDHFSRELQNFIQGTIMKTIRKIDQRDIEALQRISDTLESYQGFLNDCRDIVNKKFQFNFSKSNLKKAWLNPNVEIGLIYEYNSANFKCYLWFGIFEKDDDVHIGAEIGLYDSNTGKKAENLKILLQDEGAFSYPDTCNNNTYQVYYFSKLLNEFKEKDKSFVEKWFIENLQIIIDCTTKSRLKVLSKQ